MMFGLELKVLCHVITNELIKYAITNDVINYAIKKPSFCSGSCDEIHAKTKSQNKTSLKHS